MASSYTKKMWLMTAWWKYETINNYLADEVNLILRYIKA